MTIKNKKHPIALALVMASLLTGCTIRFGVSTSSTTTESSSIPAASSNQSGTSSSPASASSSAASSNSAASSSTSTASSSTSSSTSGKSLALSLTKTSIKEGTDFYDACKPSVVYQNGTSKTTLDATSNLLSFALTKGRTSYGLGDRLSAGSYTAKVTYSAQDVSAIADFEVVASTPVAATEGHGYTTPTAFTNTMADYPNLTALDSTPLNGIGSRKILVIPVYFSGNATFSASELTTIDKAYNGASTDTGWESLSSYYAKSSYNKLSIQATISAPFCYSKTDKEMTSASKAGGENAYGGLVDTLAVAALKSVSSSLTLTDFDEDSDGYLDGLELVYKTTESDLAHGGDSLWWNFTSKAQRIKRHPRKSGSISGASSAILPMATIPRISIAIP